tara:strand:+ start:606 stop:1433 length:828 start_codon:yes stop_codon:yes gene_type:complete
MLTQEEIKKNLHKQKVIEDTVDIARSRVAKDFFQIDKLELKLGEPLPKYWHWFFCWETANDKLLGLDGHIKPGNNIIPDTGFPRRMWGGSEINFFEPLLIGMEITRIITLESIDYKKGNSGDFCVIKIKNELRNNDTILLIERQSLVYLPSRTDFDQSAPKPHDNLSDDFLSKKYTENQLFKYSALTMNSHRIHYDLDYCKTVEYYPSLVVHGPLLAQNLIDAADQRFDGNLQFFKYRALNPIFVSDEFTINASNTGEFWIANKSGVLSMSAVAS